MARPAASPSPSRAWGGGPTAFAGARRGEVRWSAELGAGRHAAEPKRLGHWHHLIPGRPLVRGDGVVVTDWHGVLRAHGPDGRLLWERDLVEDPAASWAEFWGRLLYIDEENGAWVETRGGLCRVSADGAVEVVSADLRAGGFSPGVGKILPWGGFARSYGTDENYWTRHWPCQSGVVELLDGTGRVLAEHHVGMAPERSYVVGERIAAFFYDENDRPPVRGAALVLGADGALLERLERREGEEDAAWRRRVLTGVAAAQGLPEPLVGGDEYLWYEEPLITAPDGSCGYRASPIWEETVRLLRFRRGAEPVEVLRDVSADPPAVDRDGVCYATQVRDDKLWLVALEGDAVRFACPLLDGPRLERYAHPHGGRPAKVWRETRWFHSPTALGPDGTTLVLTNLGEGCALYCVA